MALDLPDQGEGDEAVVVMEPLGEAAAWPTSDPAAHAFEDGDAGCLPFDLYAPEWQAVWGRALRDAEPRYADEPRRRRR
jgi:hypothetical protein